MCFCICKKKKILSFPVIDIFKLVSAVGQGDAARDDLGIFKILRYEKKNLLISRVFIIFITIFCSTPRK